MLCASPPDGWSGPALEAPKEDYKPDPSFKRPFKGSPDKPYKVRASTPAPSFARNPRPAFNRQLSFDRQPSAPHHDTPPNADIRRFEPVRPTADVRPKVRAPQPTAPPMVVVSSAPPSASRPPSFGRGRGIRRVETSVAPGAVSAAAASRPRSTLPSRRAAKPKSSAEPAFRCVDVRLRDNPNLPSITEKAGDDPVGKQRSKKRKRDSVKEDNQEDIAADLRKIQKRISDEQCKFRQFNRRVVLLNDSIGQMSSSSPLSGLYSNRNTNHHFRSSPSEFREVGVQTDTSSAPCGCTLCPTHRALPRPTGKAVAPNVTPVASGTGLHTRASSTDELMQAVGALVIKEMDPNNNDVGNDDDDELGAVGGEDRDVYADGYDEFCYDLSEEEFD